MESNRTGNAVINQISTEIDQVLQDIMNKGRTIADSLSKTHMNEKELLEYIKSESYSLNQILGITIAYEPFQFKKTEELYAPYYDKKQEEFIRIENVYDYTNPSLKTSQWYVQVLHGGERWIEPYFAKGAQAMVTDFGIPIIKEKEGVEKIIGTVTLTISLNDFTNLLNALSLGKTGYGFIVSQRGNFVAHPIREYVSQKNILDVAREQENNVLSRVGRLMINQNAGFESFKSQDTDQISYLFFNQIPSTQWSLGVVFIENELLGPPMKLSRRLIEIGFAGSLFLLALIGIIIRIENMKEKPLWKGVFLLSLLMLVNITIIWNVRLNYSYLTNSLNRTKIVNTSTLNRFLNLESSKISQLGLKSFLPIPTGIYVHQIEFKDSYNVNINEHQ
jgi:hypothetical protein